MIDVGIGFFTGRKNFGNILNGALPQELKKIPSHSVSTKNRFLHACVGWIRYKPLYLYLRDQSEYRHAIKEIRRKLEITMPKISEYFKDQSFSKVIGELDSFHSNVSLHAEEIETAIKAWGKVADYTMKNKDENLYE